MAVQLSGLPGGLSASILALLVLAFTLAISAVTGLLFGLVPALTQLGVAAAMLNSTLDFREAMRVEQAMREGALALVYVAPERLTLPGFLEEVRRWKVGLFAIDEAHCISDWGFDFRPDYQRIASLLLRLNPETPVLATTATANARVTFDVAEQLGRDVLVLRGPLARSSLQLAVVPGLSSAERMAWVAQALETLPGSGIVYCLTVAAAEALAAFLQQRGQRVRAYTGALPADERAAIEGQLRDNELKAVVATSALGMGYDKPDLGFCIHVGAPDSPVSYYQQVGRAGRALDSAVGVLLAAPDLEQGIWEYFATAAIPSQDHADRVLAALGDGSGPLTVPGLEAATGIRRGRLELLLKTLRVADAVERGLDGGWVATGKGWTMDRDRYAGIAAARTAEQDLMRSYCCADRCLMRIITEALDVVAEHLVEGADAGVAAALGVRPEELQLVLDGGGGRRQSTGHARNLQKDRPGSEEGLAVDGEEGDGLVAGEAGDGDEAVAAAVALLGGG